MTTPECWYERFHSDSEVKLRLDELTYSRLTRVYLSAAVAVLLCLVVAAFAPAVFDERVGDIYSCGDNSADEDCVPQGNNIQPLWIGKAQNFNAMKQFFIVTADVFSTAELYGSSTVTEAVFDLKLGVSITAELSSEESVEVLSDRSVTHRITCVRGEAQCGTLFLAYEPFVEYSTYHIIITLANWKDIQQFVLKVGIRLKSVTTYFSEYQLYVKGAFFMLSLISLVVYLRQLLRTKFQTWSTETRGLVIVSVSCVFFNDPFFALSLKYPHVVLTSLSVASVVQFVGFLCYYWSTIFIEIRPIAYSSILRVGMSVYLSVLCLALIEIYVYSAILMKNDPSYLLADFPKSIAAIAILTLVMTGVFVLWLGFLTYRALPWYERAVKRKKFLSAINFVMSLFTASCIAGGFLQRTPSAAPALLFVLGVFNIYTILLQVLFVPTAHRIQEVPPGTELTLQARESSVEIAPEEETRIAAVPQKSDSEG